MWRQRDGGSATATLPPPRSEPAYFFSGVFCASSIFLRYLAGSLLKPHEFVHEGQTIKLCCKSCLKDFNKEPAKYLKKIEEAQKTPEKK